MEVHRPDVERIGGPLLDERLFEYSVSFLEFEPALGQPLVHVRPGVKARHLVEVVADVHPVRGQPGDLVEPVLDEVVAEHLQQADRERVVEVVLRVVEPGDGVAPLEPEGDRLLWRAGVPSGVLDPDLVEIDPCISSGNPS